MWICQHRSRGVICLANTSKNYTRTTSSMDDLFDEFGRFRELAHEEVFALVDGFYPSPSPAPPRGLATVDAAGAYEKREPPMPTTTASENNGALNSINSHHQAPSGAHRAAVTTAQEGETRLV
jgi:hypothetical protein